MKRSQILSHIRSLIIDELREGYNYSAPSFTVTKEQLPNLAEQLLDMLEFQGMQPSSRIMDCGCCFAEGWEAEDE